VITYAYECLNRSCVVADVLLRVQQSYPDKSTANETIINCPGCAERLVFMYYGSAGGYVAGESILGSSVSDGLTV
jgi:hypothetical protein